MGLFDLLPSRRREIAYEKARKRLLDSYNIKIVKIEGKSLFLRETTKDERDLARYHDQDEEPFVPCTRSEAEYYISKSNMRGIHFNEQDNRELYYKYLNVINKELYAERDRRWKEEQKRKKAEERHVARQGRFNAIKNALKPQHTEISTRHDPEPTPRRVYTEAEMSMAIYHDHDVPDGCIPVRKPRNAEEAMERYHDWDIPRIGD